MKCSLFFILSMCVIMCEWRCACGGEKTMLLSLPLRQGFSLCSCCSLPHSLWAPGKFFRLHLLSCHQCAGITEVHPGFQFLTWDWGSKSAIQAWAAIKHITHCAISPAHMCFVQGSPGQCVTLSWHRSVTGSVATTVSQRRWVRC